MSSFLTVSCRAGEMGAAGDRGGPCAAIALVLSGSLSSAP